ncbi:MAG: hypothetical protein KC620_13615 [Myxococcales bacterium]|nr:hypothetical protein [Myxococcales bacterium]
MRCTLLIGLAVALCAGPAAAQREFPANIQRQIDLLKEEPTVQQAQSAALKFFNVGAEDVEGMRSRAQWKGLMPQLEARGRLNKSRLDVDTTNLTVDDLPFLFDDVTGEVQEVQVALRWNLPLLVFNAEVLDVGSLAVLQEGVLKEVTRLYYTRRRLQIDLILNPPDDAATRISKELRIDELTSTLDAMTGNLFTTAQARRERLQRREGGF